MYLKKVHIQNVRSISSLTWQVKSENAAGWHVILGDNGAGKTSFLRSVALALVGTTEAQALRQDWLRWLRKDTSGGRINLVLHRHIQWDDFEQPHLSTSSSPENSVTQKADEQGRKRLEEILFNPLSITITLRRLSSRVALKGVGTSTGYDPNKSIWGTILVGLVLHSAPSDVSQAVMKTTGKYTNPILMLPAT